MQEEVRKLEFIYAATKQLYGDPKTVADQHLAFKVSNVFSGISNKTIAHSLLHGD